MAESERGKVPRGPGQVQEQVQDAAALPQQAASHDSRGVDEHPPQGYPSQRPALLGRCQAELVKAAPPLTTEDLAEIEARTQDMLCGHGRVKAGQPGSGQNPQTPLRVLGAAPGGSGAKVLAEAGQFAAVADRHVGAK